MSIKNLFKKKIFWVILVIIIIGVVVVIISQKNKGKTEEYVTAQVERGNLAQTVSATGKVESATETNLNFKIGGKLSKIFVKASSQVFAGQLLAQLESGQALSKVAQAQAQVAEAEADLESIKAGSSEEEQEVAQTKVAQKEADLLAKQGDINQAQEERDKNIFSLKEQALDRASETIFLTKESLEDIDEIINDQYKDNFSVYTFTYQKVSKNYTSTSLSLDSLESNYQNYSISSTVSELTALLDEVDSVLNQIDEALSNTFELLRKASSVGDLTQTIINSFKTDITTDQTNVVTKISAVQTAKSNLQIKLAEYDNAVKSAERELEKAQAALEVAQAELKLTEAGPRDFQIALYEAKLKSAQANLQSAQSDLYDYSLPAPVEGVISKIHYEVGEYVSTNAPVMSLIGKSNLEIEVDVPESDIAKINVGDEAEITLDAFSDEQIFKGHLTFIDPAETIINDVVYYKVKVTFDLKEENVKSGMTANVTILTNSRESVLYIPARAVIEKNGQRIVRVLFGGQKQEKEVTTGLRADDGLIEIIDGLLEGETVITFIKDGK